MVGISAPNCFVRAGRNWNGLEANIASRSEIEIRWKPSQPLPPYFEANVSRPPRKTRLLSLSRVRERSAITESAVFEFDPRGFDVVRKRNVWSSGCGSIRPTLPVWIGGLDPVA